MCLLWVQQEAVEKLLGNISDWCVHLQVGSYEEINRGGKIPTSRLDPSSSCCFFLAPHCLSTPLCCHSLTCFFSHQHHHRGSLAQSVCCTCSCFLCCCLFSYHCLSSLAGTALLFFPTSVGCFIGWLPVLPLLHLFPAHLAVVIPSYFPTAPVAADCLSGC